ncbi:hypothetical protein J2795_004222 [Chryseobacterium bernardetii]|uniref:Uncharacterized protein n=1 Tax=Chryseobacterium bernardetii TaxID=1241978 RepID=A0ACC6J0N7_9FLAO|nr:MULTISPECIES: DUF2188 domain-containing protein [Chryseobacterium]MDR6373034.1 hypothetical protein [Chryseobacterium vietnamense]MDR6443472.1 hypothetical protein [Chryseobacterium bernardetii]
MKKNQHVVPHQGKWAVKGAGNQKNTIITNTQKEAIDKARNIAINQESELFIHGKGGQIRAKSSYGNDPNDVKG